MRNLLISFFVKAIQASRSQGLADGIIVDYIAEAWDIVNDKTKTRKGKPI